MMTTIADAFKKFLKLKQVNLRSEQTIKWYQSIVGAMIDELGASTNVQSVTEDDIFQYIIDLRERDTRYVNEKQKPEQDGGLSRASIRSHIRGIKAFWRWAAHRYDLKDPTAAVKPPRRKKHQNKAISTHDFVKLFNATVSSRCAERDRALLAMLADTGARRGGILQLTVEDVQQVTRRARVIEKGFKQRWIYWTHYTDQLLQKWLFVRESHTKALWVNLNNGEPLQASGINQILKRLKKRSGVRGRVNPHAFRHNFARTYLQSGGDLVTLARLLGHSDVNVTADYYALFSSNELAEMQAKHSPLLKMIDDARATDDEE